MPAPCLCAGLSLMLWYISLMLWCLPLLLWVCATLVIICVFVCCVFMLIAYGPSLRADWEAMCLFVAIANLLRHGRNVEHGPFPHFLVISVELRLLATLFGPRTWPLWTRCHYRRGYYPHISSPLWPSLVGRIRGKTNHGTMDADSCRWRLVFINAHR